MTAETEKERCPCGLDMVGNNSKRPGGGTQRTMNTSPGGICHLMRAWEGQVKPGSHWHITKDFHSKAMQSLWVTQRSPLPGTELGALTRSWGTHEELGTKWAA